MTFFVFQVVIVGLCSCLKLIITAFLASTRPWSAILKLLNFVVSRAKKSEMNSTSCHVIKHRQLIIHLKSKYEFKVMTEMLWAISETI